MKLLNWKTKFVWNHHSRDSFLVPFLSSNFRPLVALPHSPLSSSLPFYRTKVGCLSFRCLDVAWHLTLVAKFEKCSIMNQKLALSHFICGPPPITWRPSLMGIIFRVAVGAGWHVIADRNWKIRHTSQDIVRLQL